MKKIILSALVAVAGLGLFAISAQAYYPREGDLIKTSYNSAVYYVDGSGYRHLFPTESTFWSWYKGTWRDQNIITLTESEFLNIPVGKNITLKPGYALMRFDNSLKIYAVVPTGKLCQAPAHYGDYQYARTLVIPSGFETDYFNDKSCDITSDRKLPDGTLLKYYGSEDIYYIQNGLRRKVTTTGFNENNFRSESIVYNVSYSNMSYSDGTTISGREDAIYRPIYSGSNYNYNYNYSCSVNWSCGSWGSCSNGLRYRSCWDQNYCNTNYNRPVESESCSCTESWSCGSWNSCAYGKQYRSCWDVNNCGTNYNRPIESRTCSICTENWSCGTWGTCSGSGTSGWQYRSCYDKSYCGTYTYKPNTSRTCTLCSANWSCTAWSVCSNKHQYRECIDTNRCGTTSGKPVETQSCN